MTPGVIYLGRIPHGFYEEQMQSYFDQFGTITKLKLYRNKKVFFLLRISYNE
jgi:nucleolar protein 15